LGFQPLGTVSGLCAGIRESKRQWRKLWIKVLNVFENKIGYPGAHGRNSKLSIGNLMTLTYSH